MNWKKVSVKDKGFWTDHHSEDGRFVVAQGHNEYERSAGRPFGLFDISDDKRWRTLGVFSTLEEATKAAEPNVQAQEIAVSL